MRLTKDDERARRICSLALEFMNAPGGVSSSEVARAHYPALRADSFRRAFARDRVTLAACGVVVVERAVPGSESLWEVDADRSFARGSELGALEAAGLESACRPLVSDGGFPLAGELRLALAKASRAFAEAGDTGSAATATATAGAVERVLVSCLDSSCATEATYVDARGTRTERLLAPFGTFGLRGSSYLVAGRLNGGGGLVEGGTRTYRMDRFERATARPELTFEVPGDFCVGDWLRLPFQMGPEHVAAVFEVDDAAEADVRRAAGGQGSFARRDGTLTWEVWASDERAAARWAIAAGVRPVSPLSLVRAWESVLGEARQNGR